MPDWATFAAVAGVVLVLLLLLARTSQGTVVESRAVGESTDDPSPWDDPELEPWQPAVSRESATDDALARSQGQSEGGSLDTPTVEGDDGRSAPAAGALLASVALSQGAFGLLVLGAALFTGVPTSALGVSATSTGVWAVAAGIGLGIGLYAVNELAATVGRRHGLGGGAELRAALAPESVRGWILLLVGVLPIVAGFEELLFRGVLIGALGTGFGVSPWLLAVGSSVAFAAGHGAQGPAGVLVTGMMGLLLGVAFVLTQSLLLVVVAHYLVNALEFAVHEGLNAL